MGDNIGVIIHMSDQRETGYRFNSKERLIFPKTHQEDDVSRCLYQALKLKTDKGLGFQQVFRYPTPCWT